MSWSHSIRRTHRWLSVAFTAAVLANFVAMARGQMNPYPAWLGLMTLVPLALLQLTGLYLLVLPLVGRRRNAARAD